VQTKDDGKHAILPVARSRDHAGMPVTLPRESDGKMRRDGSEVAQALQPGGENCPVDERGRVHGAPGLSPIAELPLAAKNRVECRNTTEKIRCPRSLAKDTRLRGRDKRPQGAARSVGCFCFRFSLIRQCAASARNVRAMINTLLRPSFPHIAEAGDG
jgi:hypothetical protein